MQYVESEQQRIRHTILEIFHRLPNNDKLRLYVREIIGEVYCGLICFVEGFGLA